MRLLEFVFCLLSISILCAKSDSSTGNDTVDTDNQRSFTLSLRSYTNNETRWVTKIQMVQHNVSESKEVEPIEFTVQHNNTGCCTSLPPRMLARVAAAPKEGPEELSDKGYLMHLHPTVSWLTAKLLCSHMGYHLALPTKGALAWIKKHHSSFGRGYAAQQVFIGINNITPDDYYQTITGQNVTAHGEVLRNEIFIRCGVLDLATEPYKVKFVSCLLDRPYLCASGNPSKKPLDISDIYLKQSTD